MDREQALGTVLNVLTDWGSRVAVADRPRLAAYIVDALAQPVERAEKVEGAARDFAKTLMDVATLVSAVDCLYAPGWARAALARHPEYAPAGEPSQDGQR